MRTLLVDRDWVIAGARDLWRWDISLPRASAQRRTPSARSFAPAPANVSTTNPPVIKEAARGKEAHTQHDTADWAEEDRH